MTLAEYQEAWAKDAPLRLDALDEDARNVPLLHAKYWKFYTTERLKFQAYQLSYKKLYRQRWEWYMGKMSDEERTTLGWPPQPLKILSGNVDTYLEGDPLLQTAQFKRLNAEEICSFLENVIKSINNRGYLISSAVNYLKFKMGV